MNSEAGTRTLCLIVTVLSPSDFALERHLSLSAAHMRSSRQLDVEGASINKFTSLCGVVDILVNQFCF